MALQFCDCGNLLKSIVTQNDKYHTCSKCEKRFEFKLGDTLIRAPAIRPSVAELNAHIIRHMHNIDLMPIKQDKECPECNRKRVRFAILHDTTWYKCSYSGCEHLFQ